jgi:hypothetical protein
MRKGIRRAAQAGAILAGCWSPSPAVADDKQQFAPPSAWQTAFDELLNERVAAARDFYDSVRASWERDTVTLDLCTLALRELRSAQLDAAKTQQARIAAHDVAIAAAKELEAKIERLYDTGARGGEAEKYGHIKEIRLETEIRRAEENASQGTAGDGNHPPAPRAASGPDAAPHDIKQLRQARVEAATAGYEAARAAYEADTITHDVLILATRELLDAELDAAIAPQDRIAALARAIAEAKMARFNALAKLNARGRGADKVAYSRFTRLDFEIRLREEEAAQRAADDAKGARAGHDDADASAPEGNIQELRRARIEAARSAYEATRAAYETDTVTLDMLIRASRERSDAEFAAAQTPKERITALVSAVARTQALHARIKALAEAAARGGELDKLAHSHLAHLDSQVRLARERRQQATRDTPATEK